MTASKITYFHRYIVDEKQYVKRAVCPNAQHSYNSRLWKYTIYLLLLHLMDTYFTIP